MRNEQTMIQAETKSIDRQLISDVVQKYVDGAISGRSQDMKSAFHPEATVFGFFEGQLLAGPIQLLFDWNDQNGPARDLAASIANIDLAETVATVRVELENWNGYRFTDLFTVIKVGDDWKITNKVFHTHETQAG